MTNEPKGNGKNQDEEKKINHGNTKLPYGLCAKHGIALTSGATPRDAWEALKGEGITPPWKDKEKSKSKNKQMSEEKSSEWEEVPEEENFFEPAKKEYVDKKSNKEAETYARETLGIDNVSYGKMDINATNQFNKSLKETLAQYPEVKEMLGAAGELQSTARILRKKLEEIAIDKQRKKFPNATDQQILKSAKSFSTKSTREFKAVGNLLGVAISAAPDTQPQNEYERAKWEFRGIFLNGELMKSKNKEMTQHVLNRDVDSKYHPVGTATIKAIIDHELGHAIDNKYKISETQEFKNLYEKTKNVENELSRYAMRNKKEFLAEAWAEYQNNPEPRPVAKKVGEMVKEEYKKWKMKN